MPRAHHHITTVHDWNVVVTVRDHEFNRAIKLLSPLGTVGRTRFYNVLVLKVQDGGDVLEVLHSWIASDPQVLDVLAHVAPATRTFGFSSADEFDTRAGEVILECAEQLAGKSFHVRLHRRGLKGQIVSPKEERRLATLVVDATTTLGCPARVAFTDPDAIVDVETVGLRAGVSVWTREERARHQLLAQD
jgi:tRNA(Ser,Leu) C12 N-acetylase TAN1